MDYFHPRRHCEFPFRRRELTGEEAPPRRSMLERVPRRREGETREGRGHPSGREYPPEELADPAPAAPGPAYADRSPSKSRARSGWAWIPLSFVFLLLGVVLGFQAALTIGPKARLAEHRTTHWG